MLPQNLPCVVKLTCALLAGFSTIAAIDNDGLTCERQNLSALGLNSSRLNVQVTSGKEEQKFYKKIKQAEKLEKKCYSFQSSLLQRKSKSGRILACKAVNRLKQNKARQNSGRQVRWALAVHIVPTNSNCRLLR